VNWLRKGLQPCLKACKDNSRKLIGDKILEHWAKYFKTQFEKENDEKEEVFQTAEPLVKEPSQEVRESYL